MWGSKSLHFNASPHEHKNVSSYAFAFKNFGLESRHFANIFSYTSVLSFGSNWQDNLWTFSNFIWEITYALTKNNR